MCQYTPVSSSSSPPTQNTVRSSSRWQPTSLFPVSPLLLLALIPFLPQGWFMNRGYTIWYHWLTLAQLLTQSDAIRRAIVFMGVCVCAGWYTTMLWDCLVDGQPVMKLLYQNTPASWVVQMMDRSANPEIVYYDDPWALTLMATTHVLDLVAHPGIAYFLWRQHVNRGGDLSQILTWPIILGMYAVSRFWSAMHIYYNEGKIGLFYCGLNVYNLDHAGQWVPAYVAETVCFVASLFYRLFLLPSSQSNKAIATTKEMERKPSLVSSESSMSEMSY